MLDGEADPEGQQDLIDVRRVQHLGHDAAEQHPAEREAGLARCDELAVRGALREQIETLAEAGIDLFVLETFRDLNEIGAAIAAIRRICDLPIVAQMTTEEDGLSLDGVKPEQFAPELIKRGANVDQPRNLAKSVTVE